MKSVFAHSVQCVQSRTLHTQKNTKEIVFHGARLNQTKKSVFQSVFGVFCTRSRTAHAVSLISFMWDLFRLRPISSHDTDIGSSVCSVLSVCRCYFVKLWQLSATEEN